MPKEICLVEMDSIYFVASSSISFYSFIGVTFMMFPLSKYFGWNMRVHQQIHDIVYFDSKSGKFFVGVTPLFIVQLKRIFLEHKYTRVRTLLKRAPFFVGFCHH